MSSDKPSLSAILEKAQTVGSDTSTLEVLELFQQDLSLRVLPVVDEQVPVGLVNRISMVEMFSRPYHRDLFGRYPIARFMDAAPIIVETTIDIDDLAQKLVSAGLQQMLNGFLVVDETGAFAGIGNAQNLLSEVTKRKQAHLHRLAHYDALTGLANRVLFRERLHYALEQASRTERQVGIVFIDIDHFKRINDTLGHQAGDELLKSIADRLLRSVRSSDTLARMGGDEFTMVLTNLDSPRDASVIIRKLRHKLAEPVYLDSQEMLVTASIGIAMYPQDSGDMDELIRKADIALYAAKHAGRNTHRFFDEKHEVFDDSRLYLETELRKAINEREIQPVFQAIVDANNGQVVGFETLARWRHAVKGMVAPSSFIPLAEDTGMIGNLDQLIIRMAGQAIEKQPSLEGLWISFNVSALEIRSERFAERFLGILRNIGLSPERVLLELTERVFVSPSRDVLDKLELLRQSGIKIAIDDFGIGTTSLRLLHQLPLDILKIDRDFTIASQNNPRVDALVRGIIDMGHALSLKIVAEGIETVEQAERMAGHGCDLLQGYFYSEPLRPEPFSSWLKKYVAQLSGGDCQQA